MMGSESEPWLLEVGKENSKFTNLSNLIFDFRNFSKGHFAHMTLDNTGFQGTILKEANFRGAHGVGIYFKFAWLHGAFFTGVDMPNACFDNAECEWLQARRANFKGSKFISSNLKHADFRQADLTDVDFSLADLKGATFKGAVVKGANFEGANLDNIVGLSNVTLRSVSKKKDAKK